MFGRVPLAAESSQPITTMLGASVVPDNTSWASPMNNRDTVWNTIHVIINILLGLGLFCVTSLFMNSS